MIKVIDTIDIRGDTYEIIENNSEIYYNGSEWGSNNSGKFKIIGKLNKYYLTKSKYKEYSYYICKFNETKTIVIAKCENIKNGKVEDKKFKHLSGVGYLGYGEWRACINGKHTKEYALFKNKILSCYNPNSKYYIFYGAKGITVDKELHNFQKFCDVISKLPNYKKWKNDKYNIWALDKDILSDKLNISPKIYSKQTCMFILNKKNVSYGALTGLTYLGIRKDGYVEEFTNQTEFAKKYGLSSRLVSSCINKTQKTHKGWVFKIKEAI